MRLGFDVLRAVPRQQPVSESVGARADGVEPEVVLDLVPQVLAEGRSAVVARQPRQDRCDEAVVLIGRGVEFRVVNTNRVPAIEQVSQLAGEIGEGIVIDWRIRHEDILATWERLYGPESLRSYAPGAAEE
jgi:hypothetical protein